MANPIDPAVLRSAQFFQAKAREAAIALRDVYRADGNSPEDALAELFRALSVWRDTEEIRRILDATRSAYENAGPSLESIKRWVLVHQDDASSVLDCIAIDPPPELTVHRVLSRAGSQKVVFQGTWNLTQSPIVIKQVRAEAQLSKIAARELHPHPLSMVHPNIIETHLLRNKKGDAFLVERLLPRILKDHDESNTLGLEQSANLFRDLADALTFLTQMNLVHGDIKPDNIGHEGSRYILLDFGICQKADQLGEMPEATPTGSLRTRAPELLLGQGRQGVRTDLWAVGATIFNTLFGRFPLLENSKEKVPRVSNPTERGPFEALLAERAKSGWSRLVDQPLVGLHDKNFADLLRETLSFDPTGRPAAVDLLSRIQTSLRPYLLSQSERRGKGAMSLMELKKLAEFYVDEDPALVKSMPLPDLYILHERLRESPLDALEESQRKMVRRMVEAVGEEVSRLNSLS